MREILFRGKDKKTNEWFYGNYYDKDTLNRTHIKNIRRGSFDIDSLTVGQFIGLTDKNGDKIFEGDIVKFVYCPKSLNREVVGVVGTNDYNQFCVLGKSEYHIENAMKGEIIGNIHDNLELLKLEI